MNRLEGVHLKPHLFQKKNPRIKKPKNKQHVQARSPTAPRNKHSPPERAKGMDRELPYDELEHCPGGHLAKDEVFRFLY